MCGCKGDVSDVVDARTGKPDSRRRRRRSKENRWAAQALRAWVRARAGGRVGVRGFCAKESEWKEQAKLGG